MTFPDPNDCELSEKKACAASLRRWRSELLIDEAEGNANAIELDRRVLDYYLDQYNDPQRDEQPETHRAKS